jgi:hypothetical protein
MDRLSVRLIISDLRTGRGQTSRKKERRRRKNWNR